MSDTPPAPAPAAPASERAPVPRGAGLFRLLELETIKLARRRTFWAGFGLLGVFAVLVLVGFHYAEFGGLARTLRRMGASADFKPYVNGLLYTGWATWLGYYLLIPLYVSVVFGFQIAGEAREGTLRTMLVRPVWRGQVLAAKFLSGYLYVLVLVVFFYLFCLALGYPFLGSGKPGLVAFGKTFFNDPSHFPWIIPEAKAIQRMALGCILGSLALAPLASLALLLSTLVETPVAAIITAFSAYMMSTLLGEVEFFVKLRPYLFTTYTTFWKGVFYPELDWREMGRSAGYCGLYTAAFLAAAWAAFRWRDVRG
ncbi:MAG: ABC transporter permease [Planctomycetes bacterium]|nr:ABC transporter permease [Planctomycetota bacterium]